MSKILVADDSRFSRNMVVNTLRKAGHETVEAANGQETLDRLAIESFDGIVTDMLMPGMSGLDMLRQLRQLGNDIPVVVCSADVQESTQSECRRLGITAFLGKPFKSIELLAAVEQMVHGEEVAVQ